MPLSESAIVSQLTAQKKVQLIQKVSVMYLLSVSKLTCYFNTDDLFSFNVHNPE